jgi:hypothetical protein
VPWQWLRSGAWVRQAVDYAAGRMTGQVSPTTPLATSTASCKHVSEARVRPKALVGEQVLHKPTYASTRALQSAGLLDRQAHQLPGARPPAGARCVCSAPTSSYNAAACKHSAPRRPGQDRARHTVNVCRAPPSRHARAAQLHCVTSWSLSVHLAWQARFMQGSPGAAGQVGPARRACQLRHSRCSRCRWRRQHSTRPR